MVVPGDRVQTVDSGNPLWVRQFGTVIENRLDGKVAWKPDTAVRYHDASGQINVSNPSELEPETDIKFPVGALVRVNLPKSLMHGKIGRVEFTHGDRGPRCYHVRLGDSASVVPMNEGELEDVSGTITIPTSLFEMQERFGYAVGEGIKEPKKSKRKHGLEKQILRALRSLEISSIQTFPLGTDWPNKQFAAFLADAMDAVR